MSHNNKLSFDSYEEMAEYYFDVVDTKPFNAYYERPATLSLLPEVKGKSVLDAGCAAGWYTGWLLDRGAQVTALDFSPRMIEMTRCRVGSQARLITADLNEPLDFLTEQSFDIVLSSLALHYLEDWDQVMKEFHRILKPGGILVFSVHHPFMDYNYFQVDNYFATLLLEDEWKTPKGRVKVHFYRRPLSEIFRPVLKNGFQLEKIEEPMPTRLFELAQPETYERLTKRPQFLFIKAKKIVER